MESRTPLLRSPEPPLPPKELDDAIEAVGADRAVVLPLALIVGLTWCADSIEISLLAFLYECVGAAFDLTSAQADTAASEALPAASLALLATCEASAHETGQQDVEAVLQGSRLAKQTLG